MCVFRIKSWVIPTTSLLRRLATSLVLSPKKEQKLCLVYVCFKEQFGLKTLLQKDFSIFLVLAPLPPLLWSKLTSTKSTLTFSSASQATMQTGALTLRSKRPILAILPSARGSSPMWIFSRPLAAKAAEVSTSPKRRAKLMAVSQTVLRKKRSLSP